MNTTQEMDTREVVEVIEGFLSRWEQPSCREQEEVVVRAAKLLKQLSPIGD